MKQIKLLRQNPLLPDVFAQVDDEDFEWLNKFIWNLCIFPRTCYAMTYIDGVPVGMHSLILNLTVSGISPDHKDHNGLNNQRNNLRAANYCQQQQNRQKQLKPTTSKYKGVSYKKLEGKWYAAIYINKKQTHLGRFKTEIAAARAYDKAAKEYFGEFAHLNFQEIKLVG